MATWVHLWRLTFSGSGTMLLWPPAMPIPAVFGKRWQEIPGLMFCGNDALAKRTVAELIEQLGWEALDVGGSNRRCISSM